MPFIYAKPELKKVTFGTGDNSFNVFVGPIKPESLLRVAQHFSAWTDGMTPEEREWHNMTPEAREKAPEKQITLMPPGGLLEACVEALIESAKRWEGVEQNGKAIPLRTEKLRNILRGNITFYTDAFTFVSLSFAGSAEIEASEKN